MSYQAGRQALYKALKIEADEAVYMFEPAFLESTVDEPLIGELEDGSVGVLGSVSKFVSTRTRLNIDKIINREGVSARTTGDLLLTGDEYEEYGEIQEKRAVECRSMTAHADVFGSILSHGGTASTEESRRA